jgi:DNA-binding NarL/FixJ family response regulator
VAEDHNTAATPVVVLPVVDSMLHAGRFQPLRAARELNLLPVSLPSTLVFRAQSDHPDVIVIAAGEAFLAGSSQRSALQEVFSDVPTVLLAAQANTAAVRSAARMKIYSVLPMDATTHQLVTAIAATVAGFAVTLPRPPAAPAETMRIAEDLTAREVEVLRSEHTAKFHVSSVLAKLGARTRTEAVTIGMTRGLAAI